MFIKVFLLFIFFAITVFIGLYARRRVKNVGDFVLGGRNVGPWLTAFAYGTSYFSAVVFVGYAGQFGWSYGVSATWIGIGNALIGSLLAWVLLGRRTRIMTKHLSASTMPEFFGKRYQSDSLKLVASIVIFIFLVPYTASVYKGLSGLFAAAFGIDFTACVIGVAVLTGIYVVLGGYVATAFNDFIQGIIMLVGIVVVVAAVLNGKGGFYSAISQLSQIPSESTVIKDQVGAYASFFGPEPLNLLGVVILTSLGTWGLPQMVHKFYTIKNEKAIKTGTIISTVFALIIAGGSYFNGSFGRLYVDSPSSVGGFDGIVPAMLTGQLSDLLMGVVIVLVMSASMSTLSSLVLTSSSTFTLDFLRDQFMKDMSAKKQMLIIRVMCVAFVLISVILALNPVAMITTLMSVSWGALGGAFLAPFLYGLVWKRSTAAATWASFAIGISIPLLNVVFSWISPINAGAIAMIASLVVFPLVSIATKPISRDEVDGIFSCYDDKVTIEEKYALPEE